VPAEVLLRATDDELELIVRNPIGERPPLTRSGGGRGLPGMAERVMLLRGEFRADRRGDEWEVAVRIPDRAGTEES
jgi:signal transduction histidine kinase